MEQPTDTANGFRELTTYPRQQRIQATTRDSYNTQPHKRIPTTTTTRIPRIRNPIPVLSNPQQGHGINEDKVPELRTKQEIQQPYILYIKEYMILRNGLFLSKEIITHMHVRGFIYDKT